MKKIETGTCSFTMRNWYSIYTTQYVFFKTMKKHFVFMNLKLIFSDTVFSYSAVSFVKIISATLLIILQLAQERAFRKLGLMYNSEIIICSLCCMRCLTLHSMNQDTSSFFAFVIYEIRMCSVCLFNRPHHIYNLVLWEQYVAFFWWKGREKIKENLSFNSLEMVHFLSIDNTK